MRTYTEHTYLEQRTVHALTHIKCDKCGKNIGTFNIDNRYIFESDIKYTGYGKDQAQYPKVWYRCKRIQNAPYDYNKGYHETDFDICPDCFPVFMEGFRDMCGVDDDSMEMHIAHMVEYEHDILKEDNDESENT